MRLLNTLLWCIKCEAGTLLPAQMVLQIVQTCIRITCSPRISDLLSSMAKNVLKEMVTCQSSHPPADTHAHARARTHCRRMGTAWEVCAPSGPSELARARAGPGRVCTAACGVGSYLGFARGEAEHARGGR